MNDKEILFLRNSASRFELLLRVETVQAQINGTFSEKSPHRATLLKELSDLEQSLSSCLPLVSPRDLTNVENEIAFSAGPRILSKTVAKYFEFSRSVSSDELRAAIERGQARWNETEMKRQLDRIESERKRQLEETQRVVIQQEIAQSRASITITVATAFLNFNAYPEGQEAITAGAVIETLLSTKEFEDAVHTKTHLLDGFLEEAMKYVTPSVANLLKEAAHYFARPDGTIAYMRHPSSPPHKFYGLGQDSESRPTGVLIRRTGVNDFQAEHASTDRVEYGKLADGKDRRRVEALPSVSSAIAYINYLGDKHWYTNFLDPISCLSHAIRYPYPEEEHRGFISWKTRAINGT